MSGRGRARDMVVMGGGGAETYIQYLLRTDPNLIILLPLAETSGSAAVDSSPEHNNGAYTANVQLANADFVDGTKMPLFTGSTPLPCLVDFYSAGFAANFNPQLFTLFIYGKVFDASVLTDATNRRLAYIGGATSNNRVIIERTTTNNQFQFVYTAAATSKSVLTTSTSTDNQLFCITVNLAQNRMRAYLNGTQVGVDQTGLGTWTVAIDSARAVVANGGNSTGISAELWKGWAKYLGVSKSEYTPAQVAALWNFFQP